MKITMYELLGMVKDGKAPKKIKYQDEEYIINKICLEDNKTHIDYYLKGRELLLFEDMISIITLTLNDEVEILEEEKKIPEKSNIDFNTKLPVIGCSENEAFMMTCISHLGNTIDKLIDYLKSKGE